MKQFTEKMKLELLDELRRIDGLNTPPIDKAREALILLENAFNELKAFICKTGFKSGEEEISFFRDYKPSLFCHLIYYRKVYEIELNRPKGGRTARREYIGSELEDIRMFFCRHREFYRYYRSGERQFDSYYFLRGTQGLQSTPGFCCGCGAEFSTGGDHILAQILAYDMLEAWLLEEFDKLDKDARQPECFRSQLTWTDKKIDLYELIYLQYCAGSVNNGKVSIRQLVTHYEQMFNIDLSSTFSRAWYNITIRSNPTAYIDRMRKRLLDRMDEDDLNNRNNNPDKKT